MEQIYTAILRILDGGYVLARGNVVTWRPSRRNPAETQNLLERTQFIDDGESSAHNFPLQILKLILRSFVYHYSRSGPLHCLENYVIEQIAVKAHGLKKRFGDIRAADGNEQVVLFSLLAMFFFSALAGAWFPLGGTSNVLYGRTFHTGCMGDGWISKYHHPWLGISICVETCGHIGAVRIGIFFWALHCSYFGLSAGNLSKFRFFPRMIWVGTSFFSAQ